ncbi:MAG TPA: XdhC family protein [Burkholderiales bacterium]|nr:XdhC family protein [Burkholderiales bacterium]
MDSVDLEVLKSAITWGEAGHRILLATVVSTWGSAPRAPGAWLVIRDDGQVSGSVSGGCIEDDLISRVREGRLSGGRPELVTYGVTQDEALRFGLPCGGTLQLVLEPAPEIAVLRELQKRIQQREIVARSLELSSGRALLSPAKRSDMMQFDGAWLKTIHGPRWRLLIIGASELARYLAQMALALDYHVIVCDPREEYFKGWRVPGTEFSSSMPDDMVLALEPDGHTAVVAATHDPKLDDLALLEALKSPAFYVGALGSKINTAKRKLRLKRHFDLSDDEIARLNGPVGLHIGSRTPPEIAVAILAELTALRNGIKLLPAQESPATAALRGALAGP